MIQYLLLTLQLLALVIIHTALIAELIDSRRPPPPSIFPE